MLYYDPVWCTYANAVNVTRLLLDANISSVSGLTIDALKLLTVLCTSEPVQMIGISATFLVWPQFYCYLNCINLQL